MKTCLICPRCRNSTACYWANDGKGGALYRCAHPSCGKVFTGPLPPPPRPPGANAAWTRRLDALMSTR